jgi:ankyrin repeat protein
LMIAVVVKDSEMINLLLGAGADVALADKTKNTAITLAEKTKNKKLIKLLEDSAG